MKDTLTPAVSSNPVLISVYAECPPELSHRKGRLNTRFQERDGNIGTAAGHSRREQLLGYVRRLRNGNRDPPDDNRPPPVPEQKRRWHIVPKRFRVMLSRIFRKTDERCRYERMVPETSAGDDEPRNSGTVNLQSEEYGEEKNKEKKKKKKIPLRRGIRCILGVLPCCRK